ncbi:MAG: hypothetical protein E6J83_05915, partial [Deltaproteobacteria bacterium]
MDGRLLGVVVAGGGSASLDPLVSPGDAALTPFAGKYRFIDFALATLANSGVRDVCVFAPETDATLGAHVARASGSAGPERRALRSLPGMQATDTPARRLVEALYACRNLLGAYRPDAIVVLSADHILQLDLRPLAAAHAALGADVTLVALPLPAGEASGRAVLRVGGDGQVRHAERAPAAPAPATGTGGFALGWAGDFIVRADALPAVRAALAPDDVCDDARFLAALAARLRMTAYDLLDTHLPGGLQGAYWHEPITLEAYYDAQMNLCTPRPFLDLYNPAWPVRAAGTGLAPAKVVADAAGRAGQALNSLVSEGSVIRGGVVVNSVLGHAVVVES